MADPIYTSASPIAVNPADGELIGGAVFTVHAPDDTSFSTPLAVTDPISGVAINPLRSNSNGTLPAFKVAGDLPRVILKSGAFVTELVSLGGLVSAQIDAAGLSSSVVAAAIASSAAAAGSASAAAGSAGAAADALAEVQAKAAEVASVVATNDGIMTTVAEDPDSEFSTHLSAKIAQEVATALAAFPPGGEDADAPIYPTLPLVARGTSLTAQTSNPVPATRAFALLAADLGISIINRGDSGATIAQVEHLAGAVPASAIIAAGSIPTSGYAVLTAVSPDVTADGDVSSYAANIAGVTGTLARVGTERRFTPSTYPASPVAVSNPVSVVSLDNATYRDNVLMLDGGTNDIGAIVAGTQTVDAVCQAIARTMSTQRTLVKRRIVWGVLDRGASEGSGTAAGTVIRAIEAFLTSAYPNEFLPLRSLLSSEGLTRAGISPTAQDTADMAVGAVPQSLRDSGSVHLNAAGMAVQADIFADWFRAKGWFPVLSPGFDDSFTRVNSATTLGTTPDGKAWTPLRGIWGIDTNAAYVATLSPAGAVQIAVVDALASDGAFEVTFGTVAVGDEGGSGLVFRAVDMNNHLLLNSTGAALRLFKRVAGSATVVADATGGGVLASSDVIRVELSGTSVVVKKNGTTVITTTVSDFATATKHGIAGNGAALNATRFERARFIA